MFVSDDDGPITEHPAETMEIMYDSDEDFIYCKPSTKFKTETKTKDNTKDIIKTKPITKPKTKTKDSIYSGINFECKECHAENRNKIALNTHSYSHNRKYLEKTEYFDINSSQNMKEFYITHKAGNVIEDIYEAIHYSLEEIKNYYQYKKVKSLKYEITNECEYKKRTKEDVKATKILFNTDYINNNAIYEYGVFKQWSDFENEIYKYYGYDFEFFRLRSIQIKTEPYKASIGSYIDIPPISKTLKQY